MTTVDPNDVTATRMRAEADLLDQLRGVLLDLADEAAGRIRAIADAKRIGAENLSEMAKPETCACCTYDCGDRRGHVLDDRQFVTPQLCVCGGYWPCEEAS